MLVVFMHESSLMANDYNLLYDNCFVGKKTVSFDGWEKIDAVELARGEAAGKSREKVVTVKEMLKIACS